MENNTLYDIHGNPIQTGIDPSEGVIGPDDDPKFGQQKLVHYKIRTDKTYPDAPNEAKEAEVKFVLPMANHIAHTLDIDIIDEVMYEGTLNQLRQRMLFVVMNMHNIKTGDGMAWWDGLVLMCKKHPVASVRYKMQLATKRIGIAWVKVWDSKRQIYILHGDKEQQKFMSREDATTLILNYLNTEGIISV